MEVIKSNFKEHFPKFKDAVEECDFIAIDTELTGLKTKGRKEHAFDTMEERYQKIVEVSKGFLIIQFGVSCFTYHKDKNKYTHKDFNFYVFPRPYTHYAPNQIFLSQPSSLHFLTQYGFDFNKLIYEGIPYVRPHEEEKLRVTLKMRHDEQTALKSPDKNGALKESKDVHIPDDQKNFVELVHKKISDFLKDGTEMILRLPPCTAYQRKLIYQSVNQHALEIGISTAKDECGRSYILVEKANEEEKSKKLQLKQLADIDELEDAIGFRNVMDVISQSQKLVIGHNMLLDIFHTVHQFFHPVPDDLREFKDLVKSIFPRLVDTKTLSSAAAFKDLITSTSLSNLFTELKKTKYNGIIEAAENSQCYDIDAEKCHEAGFDAFMTGYSFIKLALVLKKHPDDQDFISVESPTLKSYINRPFVMGHFNVQSLNLCGPDPEASRDNVFHVSFPKEWKTTDLVELFSPYGNVYISWLDDTSALVGLKSPEQLINVKRTLLKESNNKYTVRTYAEYKAMCCDDSPSDNSNSPDELHSHKKQKTAKGTSDASLIQQSIPSISSTDGNCSTNKKESYEGLKTKKRKVIHEESEVNEVSSTEKLFEESSTW